MANAHNEVVETVAGDGFEVVILATPDGGFLLTIKDEGGQVPTFKGFKTLDAARAYAKECI